MDVFDPDGNRLQLAQPLVTVDLVIRRAGTQDVRAFSATCSGTPTTGASACPAARVALRRGLGAARGHGLDRARGRLPGRCGVVPRSSGRASPATASSTSRPPSSRSPSSRRRAATASASELLDGADRAGARRRLRRAQPERRARQPRARAVRALRLRGRRSGPTRRGRCGRRCIAGEYELSRGHDRGVEPTWNVTSPFWAEAPADTRQRSAQPSWARKVVCIEQEPELGGTCLRVGCIPTKAWVQTAHALHQAEDTFAKLGVNVGEPDSTSARPPSGRTPSSSR